LKGDGFAVGRRAVAEVVLGGEHVALADEKSGSGAPVPEDSTASARISEVEYRAVISHRLSGGSPCPTLMFRSSADQFPQRQRANFP
jgi:hypothetical protein